MILVTSETKKFNCIFGEKLRELRKRSDLTQQELGDKIGISKQQISDYERGKKAPGLSTLNAVADFFGVSTDFLLGRIDYEDKSFLGAVCEYTGLSEVAVKELNAEIEQYRNKKTDDFTKEQILERLEIVAKIICLPQGKIFLTKISDFLQAEKSSNEGYSVLKDNFRTFINESLVNSGVKKDKLMDKLANKKKEFEKTEKKMILLMYTLKGLLDEIQESPQSVTYTIEEIQKMMEFLRTQK